MAEMCFAYITCPSTEEAKKLSLFALNSRLAACANILPQMESLYWWEGNIESSQEIVLILKTESHLFSQLEEKISKEHSYSTPCILKIPIEDGSMDFLNWLRANLNQNESL